MTPRQGVLFTVFAFLLAFGQILFKQASRSLGGPDGFVSLLSSIHFWSAIILYGGSTLLWIWLIRDTPLNRAYPFVALAFVVVPILSYFVLNERLTRAGMLGSVFIVIGIIISQA
jgi:drug/metabolite transporter (DMT)-like permease